MVFRRTSKNIPCASANRYRIPHEVGQDICASLILAGEGLYEDQVVAKNKKFIEAYLAFQAIKR